MHHLRTSLRLHVLITASCAYLLATTSVRADDLWYTYDGDVLPYDPSAGWLVSHACEFPCSEDVQDGHFILRWAYPTDLVSYALIIDGLDATPQAGFWVEWGYASNYAVGASNASCDSGLQVRVLQITELFYVLGDAAWSAYGAIAGLPLGEVNTFRFESSDGHRFEVSANGVVFASGYQDSGAIPDLIQMRALGGCSFDDVSVEDAWDYVRYGAITYGERVVATDPPTGFVAADKTFDRFTVTYDSPNYVYVDEIAVESTADEAPTVLQTRRLDNGPADTVEIVLDRPLPLGEHTRFILDDGVAQNIIDYSNILGDADGNGAVDLRESAAFQNCFGHAASTGRCLAFDQNQDGLIDDDDVYPFPTNLTGPQQ